MVIRMSKKAREDQIRNTLNSNTEAIITTTFLKYQGEKIYGVSVLFSYINEFS